MSTIVGEAHLKFDKKIRFVGSLIFSGIPPQDVLAPSLYIIMPGVHPQKFCLVVESLTLPIGC